MMTKEALDKVLYEEDNKDIQVYANIFAIMLSVAFSLSMNFGVGILCWNGALEMWPQIDRYQLAQVLMPPFTGGVFLCTVIMFIVLRMYGWMHLDIVDRIDSMSALEDGKKWTGK